MLRDSRFHLSLMFQCIKQTLLVLKN